MPFHRPIPEQKPTKASNGLAAYVEIEKLLNIAFVLPSALAICGLAGWWVGNRLHQHWIFIAGIVFGCIVGLFYVIQQAFAAEKISRKMDSAQNEIEKGSDGQNL
ncbi:MAG: hypothetical protein WB424_05530 [Terracidiphilus sp.]